MTDGLDELYIWICTELSLLHLSILNQFAKLLQSCANDCVTFYVEVYLCPAPTFYHSPIKKLHLNQLSKKSFLRETQRNVSITRCPVHSQTPSSSEANILLCATFKENRIRGIKGQFSCSFLFVSFVSIFFCRKFNRSIFFLNSLSREILFTTALVDVL
jgi:hypothetical protein